jgi:hypothetical protein
MFNVRKKHGVHAWLLISCLIVDLLRWNCEEGNEKNGTLQSFRQAVMIILYSDSPFRQDNHNKKNSNAKQGM